MTTLRDFLPPKSEPKNAEELARELVRQKKLTKFQAEEVYRGKGKHCKVRVSVRKQEITVRYDGKTLISWQGDMSRFSVFERWRGADKRNLFIGSQGSFVIHKMRVTPVAEQK